MQGQGQAKPIVKTPARRKTRSLAKKALAVMIEKGAQGDSSLPRKKKTYVFSKKTSGPTPSSYTELENQQPVNEDSLTVNNNPAEGEVKDVHDEDVVMDESEKLSDEESQWVDEPIVRSTSEVRSDHPTTTTTTTTATEDTAPPANPQADAEIPTGPAPPENGRKEEEDPSVIWKKKQAIREATEKLRLKKAREVVQQARLNDRTVTVKIKYESQRNVSPSQVGNGAFVKGTMIRGVLNALSGIRKPTQDWESTINNRADAGDVNWKYGQLDQPGSYNGSFQYNSVFGNRKAPWRMTAVLMVNTTPYLKTDADVNSFMKKLGKIVLPAAMTPTVAITESTAPSKMILRNRWDSEAEVKEVEAQLNKSGVKWKSLEETWAIWDYTPKQLMDIEEVIGSARVIVNGITRKDRDDNSIIVMREVKDKEISQNLIKRQQAESHLLKVNGLPPAIHMSTSEVENKLEELWSRATGRRILVNIRRREWFGTIRHTLTDDEVNNMTEGSTETKIEVENAKCRKTITVKRIMMTMRPGPTTAPPKFGPARDNNDVDTGTGNADQALGEKSSRAEHRPRPEQRSHAEQSSTTNERTTNDWFSTMQEQLKAMATNQAEMDTKFQAMQTIMTEMMSQVKSNQETIMNLMKSQLEFQRKILEARDDSSAKKPEPKPTSAPSRTRTEVHSDEERHEFYASLYDDAKAPRTAPVPQEPRRKRAVQYETLNGTFAIEERVKSKKARSSRTTAQPQDPLQSTVIADSSDNPSYGSYSEDGQSDVSNQPSDSEHERAVLERNRRQQERALLLARTQRRQTSSRVSRESHVDASMVDFDDEVVLDKLVDPSKIKAKAPRVAARATRSRRRLGDPEKDDEYRPSSR